MGIQNIMIGSGLKKDIKCFQLNVDVISFLSCRTLAWPMPVVKVPHALTVSQGNAVGLICIFGGKIGPV